jgi:hypothetical protein
MRFSKSFRTEARRRHVGYQNLINEVLADPVRNAARNSHGRRGIRMIYWRTVESSLKVSAVRRSPSSPDVSLCRC